MARPIIGKISQQAMANLAGVSVRTLKNFREEGIDIEDEEAVMKRAAQIQRREESQEDYNGARTRKTRAEADLKEHQLQVEKGEYVSRGSQLSEGERIGGIVGMVFAKAPGELTPLLAGRPAPEVFKLLTKWAREKRVELSQYESAIRIPVTDS
jgi:hypothetical protein